MLQLEIHLEVVLFSLLRVSLPECDIKCKGDRGIVPLPKFLLDRWFQRIEVIRDSI